MPPSRIPSQQPEEQSSHHGQGQTGAQMGQSGQQLKQGSQGSSSSSGPPSNEQLIQFLMAAKGLNREVAGEELAADPDNVKQIFQRVKQVIESSGSSNR